MKTNLIALSFILITFIGHAQTIEREVVSSGGSFYSNSTGQLSTTLGEPIITTVSGGGNELTQGFQQTKIDIVGIEDFQKEYVMKVFPNPTAEFITITIDEVRENLTFSIYSVAGKLILEDRIKTRKTKLNIVDYAKGSYFLTVTNNNEIMKTYKILKQ